MRKAAAFLIIALFLLSSTVAFAARPVSPGQGKNKDYEPVPNSICIDPGHGGGDIGSVNNDLLEKDINLEVASLLKEKLETADYIVFMTRTSDVYRSNADRYNLCDLEKAAILISIHHNGSSNQSVDYTSALYGKRKDRVLAQLVADTVSAQLSLPNYGISRFASGVLLKSDMPATISEGFFLTNSTEYDLIKNSGRLDQEANALLSAVEIYFGN